MLINTLMYVKENFKLPNIGDIICGAGIVPKKVIEIKSGHIVVLSLSNKKFKINFYDLQRMTIVKKIELKNKTFVNLLYNNNISEIFFINNINGEYIEGYVRNPRDNNDILKTISINKQLWYLIRLYDTNRFFITKCNQFPLWYFKIKENKIDTIKKRISKLLSNNYTIVKKLSISQIDKLSTKILFCCQNGMISDTLCYCHLRIDRMNSKIIINNVDINNANFSFQLLDDEFTYIIPRFKKPIITGDKVKYIGNKINIDNIYNILWTVSTIFKAKDNPSLDQCIISYNEYNYTVFRKELKLIRKKKNNEKKL